MQNDFSDNQPEYSNDYWDWKFMEYIHEHTLNLELSEEEIKELEQEYKQCTLVLNNIDYEPKQGA